MCVIYYNLISQKREKFKTYYIFNNIKNSKRFINQSLII